MRFLKYLIAPALALSFVGLSPASIGTAQAAPAAGVLAVERGDAKPAVENVHYRRWNNHRGWQHRHYRPHRPYYGHRYYGGPRRYGYYNSHSPGFYLSIGPRFGYGGFGGHRYW